jgi:hypothetical protein
MCGAGKQGQAVGRVRVRAVPCVFVCCDSVAALMDGVTALMDEGPTLYYYLVSSGSIYQRLNQWG